MIYHITSSTWAGFIEIEFNDLGLMVRTDTTNAELSEEQQKWFLVKMPRELAELQRVIAGTSATLTQVKQEITFELAWKSYHDEFGSKKKAHARWMRMNASEKAKAYEFIRKYLAKKPEGVAKMYFVSYLNAELWNN